MPQEQAPRLSHVGLYVSDVPRMIDFYTRVLGFVVSDGAPDGRITFLSRNPSDHHQVVLVRGRSGDLDTPMVQQGHSTSAHSPMSSASSARCARPIARSSTRAVT